MNGAHNVELGHERRGDIEAQQPPGSPKKRRSPFVSFFKSSLLHDSIAAAACLILALVVDIATPRSTYVLTQNLYWHSFPHKPNSVPSWSVPLYSLVGPAVLLLFYKLAPRRTWREVARLVVGLCLAYFLTGAITNCLKLPVGRLRPNFLRTCWPNNVTNLDTAALLVPGDQWGGYAVCDPSVPQSDVDEARKSWPSGHSSLSAAGLGFTTFFLLGQLQPFAQVPLVTVEGRMWRLLVALLPSFGAVAVGVTRVLDYWHFTSDVLTGLAIGFLTAFFVYRMLYPPLTYARCDRPWEVLAAEKPSSALEEEMQSFRMPADRNRA